MTGGSTFRIDRDELLGRVELTEVLDALSAGGFERHGRRAWRCIDPAHPDENPSVKVSVDRTGTQRWRCWSGGHGGTAIDAVMVAKSMPVGDAIRWLNDHHAHLDTITRQPAPPSKPIGRPDPEVASYVHRAHRLLWTTAGEPVRDWLHQRGLADDVLKANVVGADPGRRYLPRPKGFPGGSPAAVYPALDTNGDPVYFQARFLDPPDGRPKYDNPARRWAANPRVAWVSPPDGATERSPLVVTEGIADGLIAAQTGFAAVGVLGSQYPDARVADAIAEHAHDRSIVICFDADNAGRRGAERLAEILNERGVANPTVIEPPPEQDLTDWARHDPNWADAIDPQIIPHLDTGRLQPVGDLGVGLPLPG
ncbi:MAG: toprim domain-containing protein [Ilumatobacter sp.]|uniref:toprim domain-containing protein n=1 Tax=Ilumatobacter sp. TaxID=1967498 RepID=UPI00391DD46A